MHACVCVCFRVVPGFYPLATAGGNHVITYAHTQAYDCTYIHTYFTSAVQRVSICERCQDRAIRSGSKLWRTTSPRSSFQAQFVMPGQDQKASGAYTPRKQGLCSPRRRTNVKEQISIANTLFQITITASLRLQPIIRNIEFVAMEH